MEMLNFATRKRKVQKIGMKRSLNILMVFDALAHGGLLERGYYRHALPSL